MKPGITWAISLLAVCITAGVSIPIVRQNNLNRQLLEAIRYRASSVTVQDLIRQGADPNADGGHVIDTASFLSIQSQIPANIHALLEAGATTAPIGQPHIGALSDAACGNLEGDGPRRSVAQYRAIFEDLRSHGSNLEERDVLGFTPLMRAVWAGNTPGAKALLDMGANPDATDKRGDKVKYWIDLGSQKCSPDDHAKMVSLFQKRARTQRLLE